MFPGWYYLICLRIDQFHAGCSLNIFSRQIDYSRTDSRFIIHTNKTRHIRLHHKRLDSFRLSRYLSVVHVPGMGKSHKLPFSQAFGQSKRYTGYSIRIRTEGRIKESSLCKILAKRNIRRTIIQCHSSRALKYCYNGVSIPYLKAVIQRNFIRKAGISGFHHPAILLDIVISIKTRNLPERSIQSTIYIPPTETTQSAARIGEVTIHPDGMPGRYQIRPGIRNKTGETQIEVPVIDV